MPEKNAFFFSWACAAWPRVEGLHLIDEVPRAPSAGSQAILRSVHIDLSGRSQRPCSVLVHEPVAELAIDATPAVRHEAQVARQPVLRRFPSTLAPRIHHPKDQRLQALLFQGAMRMWGCAVGSPDCFTTNTSSTSVRFGAPNVFLQTVAVQRQFQVVCLDAHDHVVMKCPIGVDRALVVLRVRGGGRGQAIVCRLAHRRLGRAGGLGRCRGVRIVGRGALFIFSVFVQVHDLVHPGHDRWGLAWHQLATSFHLGSHA